MVTICRQVWSRCVCEVPPLKIDSLMVPKINGIYEFTELLLEKGDNESSDFQVLKLKQIIRNCPYSNGNVHHYNQLFHDNVHLIYSCGLPTLKNLQIRYHLRTLAGLVNTGCRMYNNAVYNFEPTNNSPAQPIGNNRNPFKNPSFWKSCQTYSYTEPY